MYRTYKKFDEEKFLNYLIETNTMIVEKDPNQHHQSLTRTFLNLLNKHTHLKMRIVRGNQFKTAVYSRSRLKILS